MFVLSCVFYKNKRRVEGHRCTWNSYSIDSKTQIVGSCMVNDVWWNIVELFFILFFNFYWEKKSC